MDIDELKNTWNAQKFNVAPPVNPSGLRRAGDYGSRLARRCRRFACLALGAVIPLWMCARYLEFPLWLTVYMCVFMLVMSVLKMVEWQKALGMDFGSQTMREAMESVLRLRRLFNIQLMAGIVAGAPLLTAMLIHYSRVFGAEILMAGIVGALCGMVFGIHHTLINRRIMSEMQRALSETDA